MPSRRARSSSARRGSMGGGAPPWETGPSRLTFPPRSPSAPRAGRLPLPRRRGSYADSAPRGCRRPGWPPARPRSRAREARSPSRRGRRGLRADAGRRLANRREGLDLERGAAHERSVDVRLGEQLLRVLRLDRAAVEHGDREQGLDEGVRFLGQVRRRGLARADRPDGLVGDDKRVVLGQYGDLAAEDVLGVASLALRLRLADAGDDAEAGAERPLGAARRRLVGLAEVLPPLGVTHDRAAY